MNLQEYRKLTDDNAKWRLSIGEVFNVLDEAVERIEQLEQQRDKLLEVAREVKR